MVMGIGLGLGIGNQYISGHSPAILDIPVVPSAKCSYSPLDHNCNIYCILIGH